MLKITILTMGNKMPDWVAMACQEFAKRLRDGILLEIIEIPLFKRSKTSDLTRILEKEMQLMRALIPTNTYLIALDRTGATFTSEQLSTKLEQLQHKTHHLCLLVGGPEGLSPILVSLCQERWSLSSLTLPHTLARVFLLETLYRSWSILHNHPYHK